MSAATLPKIMNPNFTALARAWAAGRPSEAPTLERVPTPGALFRMVDLMVAPPTRRRRGAAVDLPGRRPGRVHLMATPEDDEPELEA